jgi:hypothetical protein
MARTRGSLMSLEAHGTIADALTFRRGRRGQVATAKPKTPATWSAAQIAHRETVATLAALYIAASEPDKQSWDLLALPRTTTRWAEFSRENLARIAQGLDPTTVWPPATEPPPPAVAFTITNRQYQPPPACAGDYSDYGTQAGYARYISINPPTYYVYFDPINGDYTIADQLDPNVAAQLWLRYDKYGQDPGGTYASLLTPDNDAVLPTPG